MNLDFIETLITPDTGVVLCEPASQMDFVGNSQETRQLPAVFYHLFREKADPARHIGLTEQQTEVMFALKIVAKQSQLDDVRRAVFAKLLGANPVLGTGETILTPIEHVGGEVVEVEKSVVWWREIYRITILRSQRD